MCTVTVPLNYLWCQIHILCFCNVRGGGMGVVSSNIKYFPCLPILRCIRIKTSKVLSLCVTQHQNCNKTDTINYRSVTPRVVTYDYASNLHVEIQIDSKQAYWRCYISPQKSFNALLSPNYSLLLCVTPFILSSNWSSYWCHYFSLSTTMGQLKSLW